MQSWSAGQRLMSRSEPELGLGIVLDLSEGRIEVHFPAISESRSYLTHSNSLIRYAAQPGDRIVDAKGKIHTVEEVDEEDGLLIYQCGEIVLPETRLNAHQEMSRNARLDQTNIDHPRTFDLRRDGLQLKGHRDNPLTRGLVGPRVAPLAHQLYVAHDVAGRAYPRVLLADEVGLGKTIEAGLIMSSLKAAGRADRILVVVPEALTMQWVAELYRRFGHLFSVMDEDRILEERGGSRQPFDDNQMVLVSLATLKEDSEALAEACMARWDLLIVDEAHHLQWHAKKGASVQDSGSLEWRIIQRLSERSHGLLLLTATPKLYGQENLFGLLHLVDPARYPDYESFVREQSSYHEVSQIALKAHEGGFDKKDAEQLAAMFPEDDLIAKDLARLAKAKSLPQEELEALVKALVDRHGTSRVLFRNRRARIKGFPKRKLIKVALPKEVDEQSELGEPLGREQLNLRDNGRLVWLAETIQKTPKEDKWLVVMSDLDDAERVGSYLEDKLSMKVALFHEEQTLLERDRLAAWWSDPAGPQVLLTSEIGSEGRNFQFAHRLVMLDIPRHPDVIEQRIGRLDRIGQKKDVEIYVPFQQGTAEELLLKVYDEGMQAFTMSWNGADAVFQKIASDLEDALQKNPVPLDSPLVAKVKELTQKYREGEQRDIDVLIDLNSFDEEKGLALVDAIEERDDDPSLEFFIRGVFDHFAIDYDELDDRGSLVVNFHSLAFIERFPGLTSGEQLQATFDRSVALSREDMTLLSLDHEIIAGALSLLVERNIGLISAGVWRGAPLPRGVYFQFLYCLDTPGAKHLGVGEFLPTTIFEFLVDMDGRPQKAKVNSESLVEMEPDLRGQLQSQLDAKLPALQKALEGLVQQKSEAAKAQALTLAKTTLEAEIDRLRYLTNVNPKMGNHDVAHWEERSAQTLLALKEARARMDCVRVILAT